MAKTPDQIAVMRRAGRVVAEMHERIRLALAPGVTTARLDAIAREVLERRGARSNFLGYHGYPAVICASPNDVVVHGIPDDRVLEDGDIVAIDCGAVVDGWHGDAAFTAAVAAERQTLLLFYQAALNGQAGYPDLWARDFATVVEADGGNAYYRWFQGERP